jgi:hypothetical protein
MFVVSVVFLVSAIKRSSSLSYIFHIAWWTLIINIKDWTLRSVPSP